MGLANIVAIVAHITCPLLVIYLFSIQNQKMVVGSTNQLLVAFEDGCQDQLAHLEEMVSTICTSHMNWALLKSYLRLHPHLWISVVGNSGQPETNVKG
jgi:hypothetical protein